MCVIESIGAEHALYAADPDGHEQDIPTARTTEEARNFLPRSGTRSGSCS